MKLERNEIDSDKETRESRNYDTLFGNGQASIRRIQSWENHRSMGIARF